MPYEVILRDDFARPAPPRQRTEPTEEDRRENEQARQSRREACRRRIAAARLAEQRRQEIVAAIDGINAKKDDLASEHVFRCQPLQNELADIERQQIEYITRGEPTDAELDERRRELLAAIHAANADLEEAIEREDRLIVQLETDRLAAAKQAHVGAHEQDLIQLASPELRMRMRLAQRSCDWAQRRVREAQDTCDKLGVSDRGGQMSFAAAELSAAHEALNKAQRELDAATRACIDE